ncbi:MAG: ATP-binding protein, partial [Streptosporangiales bacterium]|nr:ATP-binding protein [Streptosporangiales bacterium]
MRGFVGRERELATLGDELAAIGSAIGTAKPGRCVLMRGRRRVGKSSLIEEF